MAAKLVTAGLNVTVPSYFTYEKDSLYIDNDDIPKFKYCLKREYNKKHLENIVTQEQVNGLQKDIFSNKNIELFVDIYRTYPNTTYPMTSQFLVDITIDYELQQQVIKYDEETKKFKLLTTEEILCYMRHHFLLKTRTERDMIIKKQKEQIKAVQKKEAVVITTTNVTTTKTLPSIVADTEYVSVNDKKRHPINTWMTFGYRFYKPEDEDDWSSAVIQKNDFSKTVLGDYTKEKYRNEMSHSLYSVIHPFFDEYELVVLNSSHRLACNSDVSGSSQRKCVHENTKVRIRIPSPLDSNLRTFMIIFNSRLVHAGTRSYRDGHLSSQHRLNFRLFSYVMQSYQGTKSKLTGESSLSFEEIDNDEHIDHTRRGKIDQTSFEVCDPTTCNICKEFPKQVDRKVPRKDVVVDVKKEWILQQNKAKTTHKDLHGNVRPASYVCGDLDIHGWEVHQGVQYMYDQGVQYVHDDLDNLKFLRLHLEHLHRKSNSHWKTITKSTGRDYMILEDIHGIKNKQTVASMNYLKEVCCARMICILSEIHGFDNCRMLGPNLLANRKKCLDQKYHRDYTRPQIGGIISIQDSQFNVRSSDDGDSRTVEESSSSEVRGSTSNKRRVSTSIQRMSSRRKARTQLYSPEK